MKGREANPAVFVQNDQGSSFLHLISLRGKRWNL